MRKSSLFRKFASSALALCMIGSILPNAGYLNVKAAEPEDAEWNEVQGIISGIYGEWDTFLNAEKQNWPDGPKMGNGEVGVVVDGSSTEQNYYINSNNLWNSSSKLAVGGLRLTSIQPSNETNPDEELENLAKGATVTACCGVNMNRAADGDTTTTRDGYYSLAYSSNYTGDPSDTQHCGHYEHWVMLNLGEQKTFKRYKFYHDGAVRGASSEKFNTADYRIQVWQGDTEPTGEESLDDPNWVTADTVTDNTDNITRRNLDKTYTAQYVRIYIERCEQSAKETNNSRARVQELELYIDDAVNIAPPNENLCRKDEASASASSQYYGFAPGRAIDGDLGTQNNEGWVSQQTGTSEGFQAGVDKWFLVDLGGQEKLSSYRLYHDASVRGEEYNQNTASDFKIQVWKGTGVPTGSEAEDDVNWQTVDEVTGNQESVTYRNFSESVNGQYVRVYITKATQQDENDRARIQEFELYSGTKEEIGEAGEESFYAKQDILNAQVDVEQTIGGRPYKTNSFVNADDVLITEVEAAGDAPTTLYIDLWNYGNSSGCSSDAGITSDGNLYMARETSDQMSGSTLLSRVGVVSKVMGETGEKLDLTTETLKADECYAKVELQPNQKIIIATAIECEYGFADAVQPMQYYVEQAEAKTESISNKDDVEVMRTNHRQEWKDYWLKSYVELDDGDLMKYYYGALYGLKCSVGEDALAPGIFGNFATTDSVNWGGGYFQNYNFQSTFWGVLSSNRSELFRPYNEQVIGTYYLTGQQHAAEAGYNGTSVVRTSKPSGQNIAGWDEYLAQWEPTPIADTKDRSKLDCQLALGSFLANDVAKYYYYTMDEEFLSRAYQIVKANVDFYADYLEKEELEDGSYRYVIKDSCARETSEGLLNSTLDLTYCKAMMQYAIDMSQRLGQDEDMIPVWEEYLNHLSELPTTIDSVDPGTGLEVLQEEESYPDGKFSLSGQGDNVDNCNAIFPGMLINRASDPKWVEIAQNTVEVMQSWRQNNSFVKVFSAAAYCGYDTDDLYAQFKSVVQEKLRSDLLINDNQHGIEKIGALESVNAMLLQEGGGNIYLFPAWPSDKDAEFTRLRAKGAFVISAEYSGTDQEVKNVTITSEAGEDMTLVVPWEEGATVRDSQGNIVEVTKGAVENWPDDKTITFATTAGETYTVEKGETEQEKPSKTTLEYFLNKAKEHQANGDVDNCVESIKNLFAEAITEGEAVMADENATYDEVMNATVKLMKAIQALDMKAADKTDLEMAVELAQGIDLTKYVEAGQAEFQQALAAAQEVLADGDAMQADADTAWNALVDAISNLRLKADKSTLEDLLNSIADLELSQYTEESAAVFRTALANAQAVMADETLSEDDQKTVDDAVQALNDAKDQLQLKDSSAGEGGEDAGNGDGNDNSGEGSDNTGNDDSNTGNGDSQTPGSGDSGNTNVKADAPKTGDEAVPFGMLALAVIAGGVSVISFRKKSR